MKRRPAFMPCLVSFALVALGGLAGCRPAPEGAPEGAQEQDAVTPTEVPRGAEAVKFQVLETASTPVSGITERQRLVIRDEQAWQEFWTEFRGTVTPQTTPPPVDFATHMVIAAAMGQRGTGGYLIAVEGVYESEGTLYAEVLEISPGMSCLTTQAFTAPAVAATVARTDGSVSFVERTQTTECE